jgi:hypothetical protein
MVGRRIDSPRLRTMFFGKQENGKGKNTLHAEANQQLGEE